MTGAKTDGAVTCGTCRHWHEPRLDPHDLSSGRQGECRESVHVVGVPGPGGRFGLAAAYALTPESFPACSRHQPKLEVTAA